MTKHLYGTALAAALLALAPAAAAQSTAPARRSGIVLNAGPMIGILGGGFYARINPELQLHLGPRYEGHAINVGITFVPWPNEGGPSFAVSPRYQYDQQLVPGTPFFVSPYVGFDAGLGVFDIFAGGQPERYRFVLVPVVGLDVKLIAWERVIFGFRPLGIGVPLFVGGSSVTVDVVYDIALTVGTTF